MTPVEIVLVAITLGLLTLYHIVLWQEIRHRPSRTVVGHAIQSRQNWVRVVVTERRDILAVQTLRNWIMGASFLASTGALLTVGLLSFLVNTSDVPGLFHELNFLGATSDTIFIAKCLLLVTIFLTAFFSFSISLRYFNHVSLEIGVPVNTEDENGIRTVASSLDRGVYHYTVGMRSYYLAIPITFWFFGPVWMLMAAIVLLIVLHRLDHLEAGE